jgi:hypothetical protein
MSKTWHVYDPSAPGDSLLCGGLIVTATTRGKAKAKYLRRFRGDFCRLVAKRVPS